MRRVIAEELPDFLDNYWAGDSAANVMRDSGQWPTSNVWLGVSVENQDALARIDALKDTPAAVRFVSFEPLLEDLGAVLLDGIQWAILGGESGPRARRCEVRWIRSLSRQCREQGVACFVKQLGARPVFNEQTEHAEWLFTEIKSSKGGDMAEWPADLRVREFPA